MLAVSFVNIDHLYLHFEERLFNNRLRPEVLILNYPYSARVSETSLLGV
jgi:hypothetical protein